MMEGSRPRLTEEPAAPVMGEGVRPSHERGRFSMKHLQKYIEKKPKKKKTRRMTVRIIVMGGEV